MTGLLLAVADIRTLDIYAVVGVDQVSKGRRRGGECVDQVSTGRRRGRKGVEQSKGGRCAAAARTKVTAGCLTTHLPLQLLARMAIDAHIDSVAAPLARLLLPSFIAPEAFDNNEMMRRILSGLNVRARRS